MAYSPQDVYARHLISGRGYPLWTPEPDMSLPEIYIREGLKIGDVGVVVPEDGSFDVFFNVCLPATHILHRQTGVPNNFVPILLGERDISKFPEAEDAGSIISTSSVTWTRSAEPSEEDSTRLQPGPLNYDFTLSSREGAILILPEGAERYHLRNERLFRDEAMQHAVDWYTFAEQRLGRIISHDSLYLITGFHKARSWSLAAYQHGQGAREASAQFKAIQVGRGNIAASYTWETRQAMDRRVGPSDRFYNFGVPNQTMFIRGFKIAVRQGVDVRTGFPSVRFGRARFSNRWSFSVPGASSGGGSTTNAPSRTTTTLSADAAAEGDSNISKDVVIQRFPQVKKPFHPSDVINQYLLEKDPSATVAVTHDSQWATLLEKGSFNAEDLSQEDRLIAAVVDSHTMITREGAVYWQSTVIPDDVVPDVTTSMIPEKISGLADSLGKSAPPSPAAEPSTLRPAQASIVAPYLQHFFGRRSQDTTRYPPTARYIYATPSSGGAVSQSHKKSYSSPTITPSPLRSNVLDAVEQIHSPSSSGRDAKLPKIEPPLSPPRENIVIRSLRSSARSSASSSSNSSMTLVPGSRSSLGNSSHYMRYSSSALKGNESPITESLHPDPDDNELEVIRHPTPLHMHSLFVSTMLNRARMMRISYDVTYPPSSRPVLDRRTRAAIPAHILSQPATDPPVSAASRLVLRCDKFPWIVVLGSSCATECYVSKSGPIVANRDVLYSLHAALLARVTPLEWEALGHGSRAQRKVTRAYEERCTKMGGGWEGGVRRLDWLHGKTTLVGIDVEKQSDGSYVGKLVFAKNVT